MSRVHPVFHVSRLLPWTDSSPADFPARNVPDQLIRDARDFVYGDNYEVDRLLDCRISTDPTSRARPKASCLFFLVKWSPPYNDPSHDSWEPMRALSKLTAFKDFLSTPAWQAFAASDAFKAFSLQYKSKVPKLVTFTGV